MRIFPVVLGLLFFFPLYGQDWNPAICLQGEKADLYRQAIAPGMSEYLIDLRSFSGSGDFHNTQNPTDSLSPMGSKWLFMLNESGIRWSKKLPNSDRYFQIGYSCYYFGCWPFFSDHTFPVFTMLDNEIAVHYPYLETIDSFPKNQVDNNNYIIDFGILDLQGNVQVPFFSLDTILRYRNIAGVYTFCNKINDSIYQLGFPYYEIEPFIYGQLSFYPSTIVYQVNIRSRSVLKYRHPNLLYTFLSSGNTTFMLDAISSGSQTAGAYIYKLGPDGNIALANSLKLYNKAPAVYKLMTLGNGHLLLGGSLDLSTDSTTREDLIFMDINPDDLSFTYTTINLFPDSSYSTNNLSPVLSKNYTPNLVGLPDQNLPVSPYFVHVADTWENVQKHLIRMDKNTGNISWSIPVPEILVSQVPADFYDPVNDRAILSSDSSYEGEGYNVYHHVTLHNYDAAGNRLWSVSLPDSIRTGDTLYYCSSGIKNYFPVNYMGQFILRIDYVNPDGGNSDIIRSFYFLVSYLDGVVQLLSLPGAMNPDRYYSADEPIKDFLKFGNSLYLVLQNEHICQDSSATDIALYKYEDLLSKTPEHPVANNLFRFFPNPANNLITLQLEPGNTIEKVRIQIRDLSGRLLFQFDQITNQGSPSIDISGLPAGMYFVHVICGADQQAEKFLVIR